MRSRTMKRPTCVPAESAGIDVAACAATARCCGARSVSVSSSLARPGMRRGKSTTTSLDRARCVRHVVVTMPVTTATPASAAGTGTKFVVLKFGGTSVATAPRWKNILDEAKKRVAKGEKPVVVCSAVTKISDALEKLVNEAVVGNHEPVLASIRQRHQQLADELAVD